MPPLQCSCMTNLPLSLGLSSTLFLITCLLSAWAAKLEMCMEAFPLHRSVSHMKQTVWDVQPVSLLGPVRQVDLHLTQPNG